MNQNVLTQIQEVDENGRVVVPKTVYNFRKRKFEADKLEVKKARSRVITKSEKWYEKQPFDDPVLEAKRLRALRAKINHDKDRFDLENLKIDAKELKDENIRLKEKLQNVEMREAELLEKLKDKEAAEARVNDLERELETSVQREETLQLQLKQNSQPNNLVVAVQVEVDSIYKRERSTGKR